jgi:hypothetical protein
VEEEVAVEDLESHLLTHGQAQVEVAVLDTQAVLLSLSHRTLASA